MFPHLPTDSFQRLLQLQSLYRHQHQIGRRQGLVRRGVEKVAAFAERPGLPLPIRVVLNNVLPPSEASLPPPSQAAPRSLRDGDEDDDDEPTAGTAAGSDGDEDDDPNVSRHLPTKGAGPSKLTDHDKKRAYMLARQAWIRAGKKGPEPRPPS